MRILEGGRRVVAWVSSVLSWVSAVFLAAAVLLATVNVVLRYFFRAPIPWADEGITLSLVGMVTLVLPLVEFRGEHLRVTLFERMCPPKVRLALAWLSWALTIVVTAYLTVVGWAVASTNHRLATTTPALGLPQWLPYALVPLGAAFAGLARLVQGAGSKEAGRP